MADRYECPFCGAVSREPDDLCGAAADGGSCGGVSAGSPPPVEILFCPPAAERATYSCQACGRLATEGDLVCLPKKRE